MVPAKRPKQKAKTKNANGSQDRAKFPRDSLEKALRIPKAIIEQNAGRACSPKEAGAFLGLKQERQGGPFALVVSSAKKYGLIRQPERGKIEPTELAKKIIKPQSIDDEIDGYRKAVMNAPTISDVYNHYRGENLPDDNFLENTVVDTFGVPKESFSEFKQVFLSSLKTAKLIEEHGEKLRLVDISNEGSSHSSSERIRALGKAVHINVNDICFVMQPFAPPLGDYYEKIYKPAIEKAGLKPMRADADIFGTGKIMDQVWNGIKSAKVLVAELTSRNPNVFYELGLAHALKKPVVLISSGEGDVPFDLKHIRVIYYDVNDPFWGNKLMDKVAENILSAIQNPEEAIFKSDEDI